MLIEVMSNDADPDAQQASVSNPSDRPYVVHCVGIEKEADLAPVFTVSFQFIFSHYCIVVIAFYFFIYLFSSYFLNTLILGLC